MEEDSNCFVQATSIILQHYEDGFVAAISSLYPTVSFESSKFARCMLPRPYTLQEVS